jgi:small subunit ribosomal protein S2
MADSVLDGLAAGASASGVDLGASSAPMEPTLARELTPQPAPVADAAPAPTTMEEAVGAEPVAAAPAPAAESETTAGAEAPAAEAPAT